MRYPGDGHYYVICDICGKKMRAKEARLATDIYHKNMLVCKEDYDIDNPQSYVKAGRTLPPPPALYNRTESEDVFIDNVSDPDLIGD